jgi:DNA-binding beta-propeller fold protein YncE
VSSDGSQSLAVSCCNGPQGVAIDQRGYVWATNFYGDSVSQFASNGTIISSGYIGGGLSRPQGITIDGAGTVWALSLRSTASAASPTLTQLAGSGASSPGAILSPAAGWLADANLLQPYSLAIDASGNIWLTNFVNDAQYANSNTITEVIGLASPVKTPVIGPAQAP